MDAQGTMRLMFDTMDAYDRADFDRLGEVYAEDAQWINADPKGPHCRNRDDIFTMFRASGGCRVGGPAGVGRATASHRSPAIAG
jgi:ketosteroid isomerase-like protein